MDNVQAPWLFSAVPVRFTVLCVWLLVTRTALASTAIPAFTSAEADDAALAFEPAIVGYEETVRLDPTGRAAARAEARARYLRDRSEGDFAPLRALERVRRDPLLASDPHAIDALVHAAEMYPPGLVRLEVWMLAADAYAERLARPPEAIALWRRIVIDPLAPPVMRRSAAKSLTTAELARAEWTNAEADARLIGDPQLAREVHRVLRRRHLHLASIATLLTLAIAATLAIVRSTRGERRRSVIPLSVVLGYAAYVGLAGAALAAGYEGGTARPFLYLGLALVPILLMARAWGASGATTPPARTFRAALSAASALAAAFLVVERVDIAYLEGIGL